MAKFAAKIINLPVVFAESQPSVECSPIMKVWFQRTEKENFYTHYYVKVAVTLIGVDWKTSRIKETNPR